MMHNGPFSLLKQYCHYKIKSKEENIVTTDFSGCGLSINFYILILDDLQSILKQAGCVGWLKGHLQSL